MERLNMCAGFNLFITHLYKEAFRDILKVSISLISCFSFSSSFLAPQMVESRALRVWRKTYYCQSRWGWTWPSPLAPTLQKCDSSYCSWTEWAHVCSLFLRTHPSVVSRRSRSDRLDARVVYDFSPVFHHVRLKRRLKNPILRTGATTMEKE